jgi:hypothetical protein
MGILFAGTLDGRKQTTFQRQEIMDNHYDVGGAGESDNYDRVYIETLRYYVTTANCLRTLIEERQAFTTDQLTSFENVNILS